MKLNPEFIAQELSGIKVLVPVGKAAEKFHGIVQINDSAAFIIKCLEKDTTAGSIISEMSTEYEGTFEQFKNAVEETTKKLRECGALVE